MKQTLELYGKPANLTDAAEAGTWPTLYQHPDTAKIPSTVAVTVTIEWARLPKPASRASRPKLKPVQPSEHGNR